MQKYVYVVSKYKDDWSSVPVKVFMNEKKADCYCKQKNEDAIEGVEYGYAYATMDWDE